MTAKGKINASNVQVDDRIIVQVQPSGSVRESGTKTGENVFVARVVAKTFRSAQGPYEARGKYIIETTAGTFEAAAIQTMFLAPEDAAGVKRAHVEALVWNEARVVAETLTLDSQDGKVSDMNNDATTQTVTGDMSGSAVVELLETVWSRIRENHPELPAVVMITGSGLVGASKWGHFRADGWKVREEGATVSPRMHEMFMAGETLAKGATQVLQTMLHEGAHTLARVRDIKDTSRQNRWHNAAFKKLAEEMGLEHKAAQADSSHGFSFVTLTEATKAKYADLLAELDRQIRLVVHLPVWLGGEDDEDQNGGEKITGRPRTGTGSSSNNVKLTCECEEPNIIRASRKVTDKVVVSCDDCGAHFLERG